MSAYLPPESDDEYYSEDESAEIQSMSAETQSQSAEMQSLSAEMQPQSAEDPMLNPGYHFRFPTVEPEAPVAAVGRWQLLRLGRWRKVDPQPSVPVEPVPMVYI